MPQKDPYGFAPLDEPLLEAEVATPACNNFQQRYAAASGSNVTPGNPPEFMEQPNKWGMDVYIYFNSHTLAQSLREQGLYVANVRNHREFVYRLNNDSIWWELVEQYGFRLGANT